MKRTITVGNKLGHTITYTCDYYEFVNGWLILKGSVSDEYSNPHDRKNAMLAFPAHAIALVSER